MGWQPMKCICKFMYAKYDEYNFPSCVFFIQKDKSGLDCRFKQFVQHIVAELQQSCNKRNKKNYLQLSKVFSCSAKEGDYVENVMHICFFTNSADIFLMSLVLLKTSFPTNFSP